LLLIRLEIVANDVDMTPTPKQLKFLYCSAV
jgi:hypothetical protein